MTNIIGFCFASGGIRLAFTILTTLHVLGYYFVTPGLRAFLGVFFSPVMEFGLCQSRLR